MAEWLYWKQSRRNAHNWGDVDHFCRLTPPPEEDPFESSKGFNIGAYLFLSAMNNYDDPNTGVYVRFLSYRKPIPPNGTIHPPGDPISGLNANVIWLNNVHDITYRIHLHGPCEVRVGLHIWGSPI